MARLSLKDLDVRDKRVLVRVDFNVPLGDDGKIMDDTRIRASLPTIKYIIEQGGIPVLVSHLGNPKGEPDPKLSLAPVAERLMQLLNRKIVFAPDCIGDDVNGMAKSLKAGDVMLLENTRFHAREKGNDPDFSKQIAALGDLYVNDAFGTAHRAHASVVGVAAYFENAACGLLMEKEIEYLGKVLKNPERPLLAIIGGSKVSTKMHVLFNLVNKVEHLVVGGRMCFTFFRAKQYTIGDTRYERDLVDDVEELLGYRRLYLPDDIVVVTDAKPGIPTKVVPAAHIPHYVKGVDIGPKTREQITQFIKEAKTIVWNGPMGIFEIDDFSHGTAAVAHAMAEATEQGATTIAGGGETIAALKKFGLMDKISHVSTGGGATLEFLEGKLLPGIRVLKHKAA